MRLYLNNVSYRIYNFKEYTGPSGMKVLAITTNFDILTVDNIFPGIFLEQTFKV